MYPQRFSLPNKGPIQTEEDQVIGPVQRVLVIGHGALAKHQRPLYEHWIKNGVEVHCADISPESLESCVDGVKRYVLPQEEGKLPRDINYFDLLCVNNYPEEHLITAIRYGSIAKHIVIQKPQDLNYPLIETMSNSPMYADFTRKVVVHDHYRNKGAFPALLHVLPELHRDYGQFRRLMLFLTEHKHVNDEAHRFGSLKAGMIQDLGVHLLDLFLESAAIGNEWLDHRGGEDKHRRTGGYLELRNCHKMRVANSRLGDDVETFSVMDLEATEEITFPFGQKHHSARKHKYDILIVMGKGLQVEDNVVDDLKVIVAEFEIEGYSAWIDLKTQGVIGIQKYLQEWGREINRKHGGLNRPFMLISPNPPDHALEGLGGMNYQQWQERDITRHVARIANATQALPFQRNGMIAYPHHRSLGDLIRELSSQGIIRDTWSRLPKLSNYLVSGGSPEFK